jgi:membrane protein YdbS with pleckstrin-like domain
MPALYQVLGERAVEAAPQLARRGLSVNHTQSITLGVMAVYVVVIALLWNLPYLRWSLWPFKVRENPLREATPWLPRPHV